MAAGMGMGRSIGEWNRTEAGWWPGALQSKADARFCI